MTITATTTTMTLDDQTSKSYPLVYPPTPPPTVRVRRAEPYRRKGIFPFLLLPSELRTLILEHLLLVPHTIDLDPSNSRLLAPLLIVLPVCRQLRAEAADLFYGANAFRVFPTHGAFFHTKAPLLARISPRCKALMRTLEVRLGPGWSDPPRSWALSAKLGLEACEGVRTVKIVVEVDPADDLFRGFRKGGDDEGFYTRFARGLLEGVLERVGGVETVVVECWPSARKKGVLVGEMVRVVQERKGVRVRWVEDGDVGVGEN